MAIRQSILDEIFSDDREQSEPVFRSKWLGWLASVGGVALAIVAVLGLVVSAAAEVRVLWVWPALLSAALFHGWLWRRRARIVRQYSSTIEWTYLLVVFALACWWLNLDLYAAAVHGIAMLALSTANRLLTTGEKLRATPAVRLIGNDTRPPILYLRRFTKDVNDQFGRTDETMLTDALSAYGPVVAIGRPGERLQVVGAARYYVPEDSKWTWEEVVEALIEAAQMVVLRVGPLCDDDELQVTEDGRPLTGFAWEVQTAFDLTSPEKLLFYEPPADWLRNRQSKRNYQHFREQAAAYVNKEFPLELGGAPFVAFDSNGNPRLLGAHPRWADRFPAWHRNDIRRLLASALAERDDFTRFELKIYPNWWPHLRNLAVSALIVAAYELGYLMMEGWEVAIIAMGPHALQSILGGYLHVRLRDAELVARYGPVPLMSQRLPISSISSVSQERPISYCLRSWSALGKRKSPVGWGRDCVVVKTGDRELGINTNRSNELMGAIASAIQNASHMNEAR